MKKLLLLLSLAVSIFGLSANAIANANTTSDTNGNPNSNPNPFTKTFDFNFTHKESYFKVSFADYPKGREQDYDLGFKHKAPLPTEIELKNQKNGLMITGNNHSDDLFMYAYKKVSGLQPNSRYKVNFSIEFASNAEKGSWGVGGSPGDSVYVKVGAVREKPTRFINEQNEYQMKLDKGNQDLDGKDMINIGTIGVETKDIYRLKTLPNNPTQDMQEKMDNYAITTNSRGEAWLIFGTDSGYESTTTLFYTHFIVRFTENPKKS